MNNKDYRQLCRTGSSEPARRRNSDYYQTTFGERPVNTMVGYGKRIVVFPKQGNVRIVETKPEVLDKHWAIVE